MNELPSVGVVIPNHQRAAELEAAVASVRDQTYEGPVHIYLVYQDRPELRRLLDRLGEGVTIVKYEPDPWRAAIAAQRNEGLRAAKEDLVAFLDDDDLWHPGKLDLQVRCFMEHPHLVACGTGVVKFEDEGMLRWPTEAGPARELSDYEVRRSGWLMTSSLLVRGDLARSLGLNENPEWLGLDDYDFKLRLSQYGGIAYLPQALTALRVHEGSTSRSRRALHYARALAVLAGWMRQGHRSMADRRALVVRCLAAAVLGGPTSDPDAIRVVEHALDGGAAGRSDRWLAVAVKAAWRSQRVVPALRRLVPSRYVE